MQAKIIQKFN